MAASSLKKGEDPLRPCLQLPLPLLRDGSAVAVVRFLQSTLSDAGVQLLSGTVWAVVSLLQADPLFQLAPLGQAPELSSCFSVVSEGLLALTTLQGVLFSRLYLMTAPESPERQMMVFSPLPTSSEAS